MSKVSQSLLRGAKEALEYAQGQTKGARIAKVKIPAAIDVQDIRSHLHMNRHEFSNEFGFSIRTLEKWERGERIPEGPTRAYLMVIAKNPRAVQEALR